MKLAYSLLWDSINSWYEKRQIDDDTPSPPEEK